jgi:hypothetical protein
MRAEMERLQVSVDHHKQVALDYCMDADAALRADIERLEAAIEDALPCLQEHDPEVEAICRAALEG